MNSKRVLKALLTTLLLLCLTISATIFLTSCEDGSDTLLSKEELLQNIENPLIDGYFYVADYLSKWDFPAFSSSKVKDIEYVFSTKYYKKLPDTKALAKRTAEIFVESYYDKVVIEDTKNTTDLILYAYVDAIDDPYSFYRTPSEYEEYKSDGSGTVIGIGIVVKNNPNSDGGIYIISVMNGTPAEASGLLADDIIIAIDGESLVGLDYDTATDKLIGEIGTKVRLTIRRGDKTLDFVVTRAIIDEETIGYSLDDGIGYIAISDFKENTDEQFIEAIDYMVENGAKAIIYDLRSNLGGYLNTVLNMISYIAPSDAELVSFSNNYRDSIYDYDPHSLSLPTVVLINEYTVSAAELFSSAIRDLAEPGGYPALIVGKQSYGKGIMQNTYTFIDGSAITLTIAYYNPPSGENYHDIGIEPDIEAEYTKEFDYQLEAAFAAANTLINTSTGDK